MILYGAKGHAKVIYSLIKSNDLELEYLVDDNPPDKFLEAIKIFKPKKELIEGKDLIIAIGNNSIREQLSRELEEYCNFVSLIHKSAYISKFSSIDIGTVVMPKACINSDVRIGKHCIINTSSVIDHECIIEDFVHISPNASLAGNVKVKQGAHIGIGATVIQGITIGKNAVVGAGAIVLSDVPDNSIAVGNPAKILINHKV